MKKSLLGNLQTGFQGEIFLYSAVIGYISVALWQLLFELLEVADGFRVFTKMRKQLWCFAYLGAEAAEGLGETRSMIFAVKIPFSYVKLQSPPFFSAIWRTDWIPTPFPERLEDWKM